MKASKTFSSFIIVSLVVILTIQGCQPTNKAETKDDTTTVTQPNLLKDQKILDSAIHENSIQVAMFIEQTALGGMLEIAMGKLAIDKAQDSGIKDFGRLMMQGYTRVNLELSALASTKGLRLPGSLRQKQQRQIREMSIMKNDYFEKLYLKIVIEEHDKYIELFKGALNSPDGQVSDFSGKFLPILETYRLKAYKLRSSIK